MGGIMQGHYLHIALLLTFTATACVSAEQDFSVAMASSNVKSTPDQIIPEGSVTQLNDEETALVSVGGMCATHPGFNNRANPGFREQVDCLSENHPTLDVGAPGLPCVDNRHNCMGHLDHPGGGAYDDYCGGNGKGCVKACWLTCMDYCAEARVDCQGFWFYWHTPSWGTDKNIGRCCPKKAWGNDFSRKIPQKGSDESSGAFYAYRLGASTSPSSRRRADPTADTPDPIDGNSEGATRTSRGRKAPKKKTRP